MHLRQHSPLLLQITSTNACGAAPTTEVGRHVNGRRQKYAMILNIIEHAQQRNNRAKSAAADFRTKKLSFCTKEYPRIGQFPVHAGAEADWMAVGTRDRNSSDGTEFHPRTVAEVERSL